MTKKGILRLNTRICDVENFNFDKKFPILFQSDSHFTQLVIGDVVLVKEDNLPRMSWRKRRIINVIRSDDKLVRGAEIKVRQRNSDKMLTLKRPLKYLVPPARLVRRTAAMNADLLRRLNDTDDDIEE